MHHAADVPLLFSRLGKAGTDLPPPPSRSHAFHSGDVMRTTLEAFRKALRRRSWMASRLRALAARMAFLTDVTDTPATSASSPLVRRQPPLLRCSAATTARTACSASVNRAARAGGKAPEAAQRRRRSIEAGERGREPKRRCRGFGAA